MRVGQHHRTPNYTGSQSEWREAALQVVPKVQAGPLPPLPRLQELCAEDGPSLPLDHELCRLRQPQVLLPFGGLHCDDLQLHCLHTARLSDAFIQTGDANIQALLTGTGHGICNHHGNPHARFPGFPHLPHVRWHDNNRVLREEHHSPSWDANGGEARDKLRSWCFQQPSGSTWSTTFVLVVAYMPTGR